MARQSESIGPGWYKDPADPSTQRWWDGEGWIGDPIPADATPPPGPPPPSAAPVAASGSEPDGTGSEPDRSAKKAVPPKRRTAPAAPPGGSLAERFPPGKIARPHGFPLATMGARLAARLVDIGIVFALNVVVNGWFAYQLVQEFAPTFSEVQRRTQANEPLDDVPVSDQAQYLLLIIVVIAVALWFAYEVPAIANTGQTPGKRLLNIKVVRLERDPAAARAAVSGTPAAPESGTGGPTAGTGTSGPAEPPPLGFGRSFRRWNAMGLPALAWLCYGIGFLLQLMDIMFAVFDKRLRQALHDRSAYTAVIALPARPPAPKEPQDASAHPS